MLTIKIRPVAVDRALRETEKRLLGVETNIRTGREGGIMTGISFPDCPLTWSSRETN